jgi:hypothetical protein
MSRHILHLVHAGQAVTVVSGYDRPLRELFLHVVRNSDAALPQEETFLYDSLAEPWLDWTDINTVADKLESLGIEPPASLIQGIFLDQCLNAGNRVVEHHADRPPAVLHTG